MAAEAVEAQRKRSELLLKTNSSDSAAATDEHSYPDRAERVLFAFPGNGARRCTRSGCSGYMYISQRQVCSVDEGELTVIKCDLCGAQVH